MDNLFADIERQLDENERVGRDNGVAGVARGPVHSRVGAAAETSVARQTDNASAVQAEDQSRRIVDQLIEPTAASAEPLPRYSASEVAVIDDDSANARSVRVPLVQPQQHKFSRHQTKPRHLKRTSTPIPPASGNKTRKVNRFSFQGGGTNTSTKTPAGAKSNENPAAKSMQRKQRHSFLNSSSSKPTGKVLTGGGRPSFINSSSPKERVQDTFTQPESDSAQEKAGKSSFVHHLNSRAIDGTHLTPPRSASSKSKRERKASGYLTQRLRALQSKDERMALRLRSGQYNSSTGLGGARKRRRSGGEHLDPKHNANTVLDLTVSSIVSDSAVAGDGRMALLAYIHRYEAIKQDSVGEVGRHLIESVQVPSYALVDVPKDFLREQRIVAGGTSTKMFRLYDALVIRPRVVRLETDAAMENERRMDHLPTIICTQVICQQENPVQSHVVDFNEWSESKRRDEDVLTDTKAAA